MNITYQRFDLSSEPVLLDGLVACYQDVFSGPPWCEEWPAHVVRADITQELSDPTSSCWIALDRGQVIGFTWGYLISTKKLEGKVELPGLELQLRGHTGTDGLVAYQDEVGVRESHRKRGIAHHLVDRMVRDLSAGSETLVARTKADPPTALYAWYLRSQQTVIRTYNDDSGRVILAGRTCDVQLDRAVVEPQITS